MAVRRGVRVLIQAKSRDEWMQRMIQVGTLLVPGSWWQGVGEEEKRTNYPCEIVNVHFVPNQNRYEFEIECVDKTVDDQRYEMLWTDVYKYVHCV